MSDDPYDIRTRVVVEHQPGRYKYVATELASVQASSGMAKRGYVVNEGERARGVNEAGFGFTWAFAQEARAPQVERGLSSGEFSRRLLSECSTVDDAIALVDREHRNFSGAWMFVDAAGAFAQVEIARTTYSVVDRLEHGDGGIAVNVNCYQRLRDQQDVKWSLDSPVVPNATRFSAATTRLTEIAHGATHMELAGVLADHQHQDLPVADETWVFPGQGHSICNHGTTFGTVSAEIIDPVARTFWYCFGWPCGTAPTHPCQVYQEHSWGRFLPFSVSLLPPGYYTTLTGELSPLAAQHIEIADAIDVRRVAVGA